MATPSEELAAIRESLGDLPERLAEVLQSGQTPAGQSRDASGRIAGGGNRAPSFIPLQTPIISFLKSLFPGKQAPGVTGAPKGIAPTQVIIAAPLPLPVRVVNAIPVQAAQKSLQSRTAPTPAPIVRILSPKQLPEPQKPQGLPQPAPAMLTAPQREALPAPSVPQLTGPQGPSPSPPFAPQAPLPQLPPPPSALPMAPTVDTHLPEATGGLGDRLLALVVEILKTLQEAEQQKPKTVNATPVEHGRGSEPASDTKRLTWEPLNLGNYRPTLSARGAGGR